MWGFKNGSNKYRCKGFLQVSRVNGNLMYKSPDGTTEPFTRQSMENHDNDCCCSYCCREPRPPIFIELTIDSSDESSHPPDEVDSDADHLLRFGDDEQAYEHYIKYHCHVAAHGPFVNFTCAPREMMISSSTLRAEFEQAVRKQRQWCLEMRKTYPRRKNLHAFLGTVSSWKPYQTGEGTGVAAHVEGLVVR